MTIKLFSSNDGVVRLEVSLDQDTAWLTQSQMEELPSFRRNLGAAKEPQKRQKPHKRLPQATQRRWC